MKNLVFESLDELFENKKAKEAKKEDVSKTTNVSKEKEKTEKTKPIKINQEKNEKIKQAIKALEAELAKAKKPGAMKQTPSQKKAKIEEIQKKIDAWKKKLN